MPKERTARSDRVGFKVYLDQDVRAALRLDWATNGGSMSDAVNLAVREFFRRNPKPPKPAA